MYHAHHEPKKLQDMMREMAGPENTETRANALGLETEPFPDVDDLEGITP